MNSPFLFKTRLNLVQLLVTKAKNTTELLEGMKTVPLSSIYYHTHRYLQQQQHFYPEPPNDFAYWLTNVLNLKQLGESIASINITRFAILEDLRNEFVEKLSNYCTGECRMIDCPPDQEFHFMKCKTFILPTSYSAQNLNEFIVVLSKVSINSLSFHIFEARLRLNRNTNDFSNWFRSIGYGKLAQEIENLDPYSITLEGLRKKIISIIRKYG